jgi:small subunit ribosomal protein S8
MLNDPISDMLSRIKNAINAGHDRVEFPASKIKASICKVLKEEGYIRGFKVISKEGFVSIKVLLKEDAIVGLKRYSKPGLRQYRGYDNMPRVLSGLGTAIVSTSKGVISSRDARKLKVGGEVLCSVW